MDKKILMIGVSTAQNTTNVLPALQLKSDAFIALETSAAHARKWSDGMISVLKKHEINVLNPIILESNEDSRVDLIINKIEKMIPDQTEVLWNLGGGQKPQQLAMWQMFINRTGRGLDDLACYANPENHALEMWEHNDGVLEFFTEQLESSLSATDIFEIYGYEVRYDTNSLFYKNGEVLKEFTGLAPLMKFEEFRQFFYLLPTKNFSNPKNQKTLTKNEFDEKAKRLRVYVDRKLHNKVLDKFNHDDMISRSHLIALLPTFRKIINQNYLEFFNKELPIEKISIKDRALSDLLYEITKCRIDELIVSQDFLKKYFSHIKISFLFEEVLVESIAKILLNSDNKLIEAYSNITVWKDGKQVAEHDVLLVTSWGTIISLDAKTFDVELKDVDARKLNLREGAGRYIQFIPVFPLFVEDFDKAFFPAQLRQLPDKLKAKQLKYFTYNYEKSNRDIIHRSSTYPLNPINNMLAELGLIN